MFSNRFTKILHIIIILFIITTFLGSVYGAGLRASPPDFKYNLNPSQTVNGQITVTNIGDVPMNVVVDKKRLLMDSMHMVYSDKGIATWIKIGINNFTLSPGESKVIPFTLTSPAQINYNDAMGAVVIRGIPPEPQKNNNTNTPNLGIRQGIELVIPLIVGLPGPIIESLQLLEHKAPIVLLSFMPGDFIYELNNNGTVYANMTGNIEINGLLSKQSIPIEGIVYPEDDYTLSKQWAPGFSDFGIYSAKTTINYGRLQQTKTIETNDTILVIPVWLIILIVLAVVIYYIRKKDIKPPIKIKIEKNS
ncbi:MAG: hypothetical protein ACPK7O_05040 [Methanobacterium sp.]